MLLRHDNADRRLTARGRAIGLVDGGRWEKFTEKRRWIEREERRLFSITINPSAPVQAWLAARDHAPMAKPLPLGDLLKRNGMRYEEVLELATETLGDAGNGNGHGAPSADAVESLVVGIRYAGYIAREEMEAGRQRAMEERQIPAGVDYEGIRGLSNEGRGKLKDVRPLTVGQASRIPGLTPADISILLVYLEARARREAAAISPDLAGTSF
jgi:tRNA uridine 5-carboxymethylaminomethyl modification enzyme